MSEEKETVEVEKWYENTGRGLRVTRVPSFDEWAKEGVAFAEIKDELPFAIGDWVNIGERTFREKYAQAVDIFGEYAYQTIANYASTMRRVPLGIRHKELGYGYHEAVAHLHPDSAEQAKWLQQAFNNFWRVGDLRAYLRGEDPTELPHEPTPIDYIAQSILELREALNRIRDDYKPKIRPLIESLQRILVELELAEKRGESWRDVPHTGSDSVESVESLRGIKASVTPETITQRV